MYIFLLQHDGRPALQGCHAVCLSGSFPCAVVSGIIREDVFPEGRVVLGKLRNQRRRGSCLPVPGNPPCKREKGDAGGKLCFKTPQIPFFHPLRRFVDRELKNKKAAASDCLHAPLIVFTSSARPSLLAVIKSACWRGIGLNCKAGAWKSLGRPIGGVSEVFFCSAQLLVPSPSRMLTSGSSSPFWGLGTEKSWSGVSELVSRFFCVPGCS